MLLGGEMIAVGRYERTEPGEAEVAFLVRTPTRAGGSASCCSSTSPRRAASAASSASSPRCSRTTSAMIPTFREAGYRVASELRPGRDDPGVLHRPDRHRDRGHGAARPPRRGPVDRALRQRRLGGGHRGQPAPGQHRPGAGAQPGARRLHRQGLRGEPDGHPGVRAAGVRHGRRDPGRGRHRRGRRARRLRAGRRARLRRQGRARADRHLVRLRRDRRGGPAPAAPAGRPGALLRPAADRPQLPGPDQHRSRRAAQRLALAGDAAARAGRLLLPVRRPRLGDPQEGLQPRPRPLDLRQRRQPRGPVRQRPPAVLGGGRLHRGGAALPRVDRQPAQVLPDRPPGLAPQAGGRGPLRPHHAGRADGARGPQDRRPGPGRRRDVPAGGDHPGRDARRDVRRRPAGGAPAVAPRAPDRGRRQLRRPRAARHRRRRRRRARGQPLGVARPRSRGGGLRGRPRRGDRRPGRRLGGRGLHPAAQHLAASRSPTCSPPWGSSPTSRW